MAPKTSETQGFDDGSASTRLTGLYEEHGRDVLAYAMRRATAEDAADAVAETFLIAWRRLADIPSGEEARPWLYGVTRRVLANQARGERRRGLLAERLRHELASLGPDPAGATGVAPDEGAAVLAALASIDETDREILRLVAWEGMTPKQAGKVIGIPAVTARSRLHRARGRMRAALTATAVLLLVALGMTATPQGEAVAGWIGERFGIGQPGGPPALQGLREFAIDGSEAEGRPAYVLVRGDTPSGGHYMLVTYRMPADGPADMAGKPCFELHTTDPAGLYGQGCEDLPRDRELQLGGIGGSSTPDLQLEHLTGRVGAEVDRVTVSFEGEDVPVELTEVPAEVRERAGIAAPFKFFIAFPRAYEGGTAVVTAYDSEGKLLARERAEAMNRALISKLLRNG